ncbi:MAG: hypothetical protein AAF959_27510 [Cyanobacteria bacterium P01_D01_bin.56]
MSSRTMPMTGHYCLTSAGWGDLTLVGEIASLLESLLSYNYFQRP